MFGKIVAFLAVATSVAFANPCGFSSARYGSYVNSVPVLGIGGCSNSLYGQRVLSIGSASPIIRSEISATPAFRASVGAPEVISSCEDSFVSPSVSTSVVSSGLFDSILAGSRNSVVATAC